MDQTKLRREIEHLRAKCFISTDDNVSLIPGQSGLAVSKTYGYGESVLLPEWGLLDFECKHMSKRRNQFDSHWTDELNNYARAIELKQRIVDREILPELSRWLAPWKLEHVTTLRVRLDYKLQLRVATASMKTCNIVQATRFASEMLIDYFAYFEPQTRHVIYQERQQAEALYLAHDALECRISQVNQICQRAF